MSCLQMTHTDGAATTSAHVMRCNWCEAEAEEDAVKWLDL